MDLEVIWLNDKETLITVLYAREAGLKIGRDIGSLVLGNLISVLIIQRSALQFSQDR